MQDKQRLLAMLNENKISEADFKILSEALDKKPSGIGLLISFLINPFQKINGITALLIGIAVLLLMALIGFQIKVYFTNVLGIVTIHWISQPKIPYSFVLLLYQNLVCCLTLSLCYLLFAKIFQQKRLRIIDFFGMVALSRLPFLVYITIVWVILLINPALGENTQLHISVLTTIETLLSTLLAFWQLAAYFYALKESSGLTGSKLLISAIGSFVLGSMISAALCMFFV